MTRFPSPGHQPGRGWLGGYNLNCGAFSHLLCWSAAWVTQELWADYRFEPPREHTELRRPHPYVAATSKQTPRLQVVIERRRLQGDTGHWGSRAGGRADRVFFGSSPFSPAENRGLARYQLRDSDAWGPADISSTGGLASSGDRWGSLHRAGLDSFGLRGQSWVPRAPHLRGMASKQVRRYLPLGTFRSQIVGVVGVLPGVLFTIETWLKRHAVVGAKILPSRLAFRCLFH